MDEYQGIEPDHFASFRRYLREQLTERVPIKEFYEIDGSSEDSEAVCQAYAARLKAAEPKLCLLGIGENGHLAFNDPSDADFRDVYKRQPMICWDLSTSIAGPISPGRLT